MKQSKHEIWDKYDIYKEVEFRVQTVLDCKWIIVEKVKCTNQERFLDKGCQEDVDSPTAAKD